MRGLMMESPLTIPAILRRAARVFPDVEIVSRMGDGTTHRYTYAALNSRVLRLMDALHTLGVQPGDRVGSFGWNSYRHLELYFAVPSMGAVLHTLNIRLSPQQIRFIVSHAEDRLLFVDRSLAGSLRASLEDAWCSDRVVMMDDGTGEPAAGALEYERLVSSAEERDCFPDLDEDTAAGLCYTSGTTGDPKGVLASHRSQYLHAMGACMADSVGVSCRDSLLPVVPMFHAWAWGLPYASALTGARQVLPGSRLLGAPLAELIETERVTLAAGVPTIWNVLYHHLKGRHYDLSHLRKLLVGGSAMPASLIRAYEDEIGVPVVHAWGMTEISPIGTLGCVRPEMDGYSREAISEVKARQGIPVPGVEIRIQDEGGVELPWDGVRPGELAVRGPWVAASYFKSEDRSAFTDDGWFLTGDIATVDANSVMQITDRQKDVIKSRGEWISSVEMENEVMAVPGVLEAAVIARPHDLKGETPVAYVVRQGDAGPAVDSRTILDALRGRFEQWQLPHIEDIQFVDSIPKTSVGKIDKKLLRATLLEQRGGL